VDPFSGEPLFVEKNPLGKEHQKALVVDNKAMKGSI
jgi:hypothetical protein